MKAVQQLGIKIGTFALEPFNRKRIILVRSDVTYLNGGPAGLTLCAWRPEPVIRARTREDIALDFDERMDARL